MTKPKVICIGLSKTGTTTISSALRDLGYKVGHYVNDPFCYDQYEALSDVPVAVEYRALDMRYPDAKFILTERGEEEYMRSARVHFRPRVARRIADVRWRIYGTVRFNEKIHRHVYRDHNRAVKEYFALHHDPSKLLVIDVCSKTMPGEEKWQLIADHLGVSPPHGKAFPWKNKHPKHGEIHS